MKVCITCKETGSTSSSSFCSKDGTKLIEYNCSYCQRSLHPNENFCDGCGHQTNYPMFLEANKEVANVR